MVSASVSQANAPQPPIAHPADWQILGHDWAIQLLRQHVAQGQLRHAYLLTGPRGLGRRTLALHLAQSIQCTRPPAAGVPCRTCRDCQQIERMQHPDLAIVQAEEAGGTLRVDQVRSLQHTLALAPYSARYRLALLLNFEDAHLSAANALLKTLEEPPPQVVLILTAENAENLLPTIVSRCEVLRLRPLALAALAQGLQSYWRASPAEAEEIAHLSLGRPGYAVRLLQDPTQVERRNGWLDEHGRLLSANLVDRFAFANAAFKEKAIVQEILQVYLSFWHDVVLCSTGLGEPIANIKRKDEIEALAHRLEFQEAYRCLKAIERTINLVDHNTNIRLALEVLWLDLPHLTGL
jgi:DNA polymerase-3 subunit delta'